MAFTFPISFSTLGASHRSGWNLGWEVGWPQAWESGDWVFLIINAEPGSHCRECSQAWSHLPPPASPQDRIRDGWTVVQKELVPAHASQ